MPIGVEGEVYLGGAGLARGYMGDPALTAERFLPDPFAGHHGRTGDRLYRTGDRASLRPDGRLEFRGRVDRQIKVRGFRIEPGEIETALVRHPRVAAAVVEALSQPAGDTRLVAYVVAAPGQAPTEPELRAELRRILPEPMVPAAWIFLPALPRTARGKVDRAALPAPPAMAGAGASPSPAPAWTPMEEMLAGIWKELLGVEPADRQDSFFDLGGHSLLATRLLARISQRLAVDLPLATLFAHPTLGETAAALERLQAGPPAAELEPLVVAPSERPLPASFAQERFWFLDRLAPGLAVYNVATALWWRGELSPSALARAWSEVVRRHEALRTHLVMAGGELLQIVAPPEPQALPVIDLDGLPDAPATASRLAAELARRPFDLSGGGGLVRCLLLRLEPRHHLVALCLHHAVCDGWSMDVLLRELGVCYRAFVRHEAPRLPALPLQYGDFSAWQRRIAGSAALAAQAAYWREKLAGAPQALALPLDRPRPAVQTFAGHVIPVNLQLETARPLARREGVTLFMALLAAYAALLQRYGGQEEVVVGSPIANRRHQELEGAIGCFVNTLALRVDLAGGAIVGRELLARIRDTALGAYSHQDLPFERLVEELAPSRDLSRSPLFQALFVLQPSPDAALAGLRDAERTVAPLAIHNGAAKFELTLFLTEAQGSLGGGIKLDTDLLDRTTGARMAGHLAALLRGLYERPEEAVAELPMLAEHELPAAAGVVRYALAVGDRPRRRPA